MLIEKCPKCGESLASSTLGSTVVSCGRCSGAFVMAKLLASAKGQLTEGALPAPPSIALPAHFRERYEIGAALGRGTMGLVFGGRDLRAQRDIAIKVLLSARDDDILARFLREAEILASVVHPHLVQVVDLDQLDGHPCLITEFLGGGTLRDKMMVPMSQEKAVPIAAQCLSALDACHAAGIVHRDLKPENILFTTDGQAKVADLGIAKVYGEGDRLTRTGAFIGTPRYMSPEQARGLPATASADIWSMGVILYEMISGQRPHDGESLRELLSSILTQPAPKLDEQVPGVSRTVARVVDKALAKKPEERFASAGEMSLALLRALDPTSGPLAMPKSDFGADSEARRAAIRSSAKRALASMQPGATASGKTPAPAVVPTKQMERDPAPLLEVSADTAPHGLAEAQAAISGPRQAPTPRTGTAPPPAGQPTPPAPVRPPSGSHPVSKPRPAVSSRVVAVPAPPSARRRMVPVVAAALLAVVGLAVRALLAPTPGDPRTVAVHAGITGALCVWRSTEPYAAVARAYPAGGGDAVTAREESPGLDHALLVTGLQEGRTYEIQLERGGYVAFPRLRVQLGRALEMAPALALTVKGPDEVEALAEASVPVAVVSATTPDPSISVEASKGPTAPIKLVLKGPGAAAGFLDLKLQVQTVCGVTAERTLRVNGGAERLRDYTASARFVRDLEALDKEIANRRFPVSERELRAEARLKSFPAMSKFVEDLPALQHVLTAENGYLPRRFRIYEVVSDLLVMEKLMEARLLVPEPGLSLGRDALVSRLVDVRKASEQLVPAGSLSPPPPRAANAKSLLVTGYGKGALATRGPGQTDVRAGMKQVVGGLVDLTEMITVPVPREALPEKLERIRISILGRCIESHVCLNVQLNRTWRMRYFGSSVGLRTGRLAATDFLTSDAQTEKNVPRAELYLDLPVGLFNPGENRLEITAQVLVAEMGANTVFCAPLVHEVFWGPTP